jgi:hypothetical protein
LYKCSNSCLWCSCWWNLEFSFKSYGKESLYKYCMNVDDGRIMHSWRSCLLKDVKPFLQKCFMTAAILNSFLNVFSAKFQCFPTSFLTPTKQFLPLTRWQQVNANKESSWVQGVLCKQSSFICILNEQEKLYTEDTNDTNFEWLSHPLPLTKKSVNVFFSSHPDKLNPWLLQSSGYPHTQTTV